MLTNIMIEELKTLLPGKIFISQDELQKHSGNLFYISNHSPEAICYAESEDDVITITDFCIKNKIPLIPYGSGTSVEGHTAAVNGACSSQTCSCCVR